MQLEMVAGLSEFRFRGNYDLWWTVITSCIVVTIWFRVLKSKQGQSFNLIVLDTESNQCS